MKLWLLRPTPPFGGQTGADGDPWTPWYDKTFGFVVRAETERAARVFAHAQGGDENSATTAPWLNEKYSTCVDLSTGGEQGVVIEDIHYA